MIELPELILVRHGEVDLAWKGICYGAMDLPLSETGTQQSLRLAESLCARWQPSAIVHTGLMRTKFLAEAIANACSFPVAVHEDARLRERNFGEWQGMTWDSAYASDPENFHGLIEHPDTYRPPHGETTSEMQVRAVASFNAWNLARGCNLQGPTIVVAHSGPIAAILGHLLQIHARDWGPWMIRTLECVAITNLSFEDLNHGLKVHCVAIDLLNSTSKPKARSFRSSQA